MKLRCIDWGLGMKLLKFLLIVTFSIILAYGLFFWGIKVTSDKLKESILMELGKGRELNQEVLDYSNAQEAFDNSFGKPLQVKAGSKLYIEVPSDKYPNLQIALDDLRLKSFERGSNLEIRLKPGVFDYNEQVIVDGLNAPYLDIKGKEKIEINTSGVHSVTSHTYNIEYYDNVFKKLNYHKVTYNVPSIKGIRKGQFVIIKDTEGATNHSYHQGVWEIIDVDTNNNRMTILHTGHLPPPNDISGSMIIPQTVIRWVNNTTAFLADRNTTLGTIDNVVFVGAGRPENDPASGRGPANWDMVGGKGGVTGLISRDSSTLKLGANFAITSFSGSNVYATQSAQIDANSSVSSSAARVGLGAASGASMQVNKSIASGNLLDGILAQDNSFTFAKSAISVGNHRHGFVSSGNSNVNSDNAIAMGNRYSGGVAIGSFLSANGILSFYNGENGLWVYNGGKSRAVGAQVKSNKKYGIIAQTGSHITASKISAFQNHKIDIVAVDMSNILVTGYLGSPTFRPQVDTVEKDGSFIKIN